jgi:predicted nucleic acid-binding protein
MSVLALADTSVWGKRHLLGPRVRAWFEASVRAGRIATCDQVIAELLYSARTHAEFRDTRRRLSFLPSCPIGAEQWRRAFDVWELFAAEGGLHHRRVKFADCLIAAAAEAAGAAVLHYDADYDAISGYTQQAVRSVAPLGSL